MWGHTSLKGWYFVLSLRCLCCTWEWNSRWLLISSWRFCSCYLGFLCAVFACKSVRHTDRQTLFVINICIKMKLQCNGWVQNRNGSRVLVRHLLVHLIQLYWGERQKLHQSQAHTLDFPNLHLIGQNFLTVTENKGFDIYSHDIMLLLWQ